MSSAIRKHCLAGCVVAAGAILLSAPAFAADFDAAAAVKLARKDHCLRCHAVAKKKEGPAYQSVAYKFKGQADAEDKLVKHLTSGEKVKLSDGHLEDHKMASQTPEKDMPQIKNLIRWILAQ